MSDDKNKINERINKVKNWFKNPYNSLLVAILLFALIIRIYYFFMTKSQPLWWDEAEYMLKAKNIALGTPETGWTAGLRPILLPFIASFFFLIGVGDTPIRFILALLSVCSLYFIFLIGKNLFNERVGLIGAAIMSVFYIDIFYTTRLLVDIPQVFFITLAAALFTKYAFVDGDKRLLIYILPVIIIGTLMRFTVGLFAIIILIFLILTQGIKFLKQKEWYISGLISFLLFSPYMIYLWIKLGNPFFTIQRGLTTSAASRAIGVTAFDVFMEYIRYFPAYAHWIFFYSFLIGLGILLFYLVLSIDKIKSNKLTQKYLLLVIWIVFPLVYFGFLVNHFEDRYIFMIFPAVFLIAGLTFERIYNFAGKYSKIIGVIIIISLIAFGAWHSLQRTDNLIKSKISGYQGLKDAGLWIKDNSNLNDSIVSSGMPELTYYSERATYPYPLNESELPQFANEKNALYMVLSIWERTPEWTYVYPDKDYSIVEPVIAFYMDKEEKQISAIVYRFKN